MKMPQKCSVSGPNIHSQTIVASHFGGVFEWAHSGFDMASTCFFQNAAEAARGGAALPVCLWLETHHPIIASSS